MAGVFASTVALLCLRVVNPKGFTDLRHVSESGRRPVALARRGGEWGWCRQLFNVLPTHQDRPTAARFGLLQLATLWPAQMVLHSLVVLGVTLSDHMVKVKDESDEKYARITSLQTLFLVSR
jgi:hypothetical protein